MLLSFSIVLYCINLITATAPNNLDPVSSKKKVFQNDNGWRKFGDRSRNHIESTLHLRNTAEFENEQLTLETLKKLSSVYKSAIKPLEAAYKFNDMNRHVVSEGEIFAVPRVVFIGPWSTGKSSLINYILGVENSSLSLPSGAQPTTSDFTVLTYGEDYKSVEGNVLVMDSSYSSLEKFGHNFLERLESIHIPSSLLKMVNFIDTPGIIENRKQQERGYPFTDVCQWFIDRSDLIILVFDPTKLDVGVELEMLFKQLKGHEAKVRIILNKADTVNSQELMRVYGTLFWSLAPLINVTEPPRVYIGSFWSKAFHPLSKEYQQLFLQEEVSLLQDIYEVMSNRLQNKIAFIRQHAVSVRNHALLVDQYLHALHKHRSIFQDINDLAGNIAYTPDEYKIYQTVLAHPDVSRQDLPPRSAYIDFFSVHSMDSFLPLSKHCGFISSCLLDSINYAIHNILPVILEEVDIGKREECLKNKSCKRNTARNMNTAHEKQKYSKQLNP